MKSIGWISIVLAIMFLGSCQESEVPEEVLSPEVMADVVEELLYAKQEISYHGVSADSMKLYYDEAFLNVLESKGTDTVQYRLSYDYYMSEPKIFLPMWTMATDSLKHKMQRAEAALGN